MYSNIYMSFSGEVVFVSQLGPNAAANPAQARFNPAIVWHISSSYKVYLSKPKRIDFHNYSLFLLQLKKKL